MWATVLKWLPKIWSFVSSSGLADKVLTGVVRNIEEPNIKTEDDFGIKRIAIIVGHTLDRPGTKAYSGLSEYAYNSQVAMHMVGYSRAFGNIHVEVFIKKPGQSTRSFSKYIAASNLDPCMTVELHLNSFRYKAYGCETLILKGDHKSEHFGRFLSKSLHEDSFFNFEIRRGDGIKELTRTSRGYSNLSKVKQFTGSDISVLFEPTFVNYQTKESKRLMQNPEMYAEFLVYSIVRYFDI